VKKGRVKFMDENVFEDELVKDEKILWTGQPNPRKIFSKADIFFVPFSIMWGGFALFWEGGVLFSGAPAFFALWGIPFVLIGLYITFGRFIYKSYKKTKTYYALTNKRVISVFNKQNKVFKSEFIDRLTSINKGENSLGEGSIRFGKVPFGYGMYENTGMDFFMMNSGYSGVTFYDIEEVDIVYRLVNDLRKNK
jgi:hypothetical protein